MKKTIQNINALVQAQVPFQVSPNEVGLIAEIQILEKQESGEYVYTRNIVAELEYVTVYTSVTVPEEVRAEYWHIVSDRSLYIINENGELMNTHSCTYHVESIDQVIILLDQFYASNITNIALDIVYSVRRYCPSTGFSADSIEGLEYLIQDCINTYMEQKGDKAVVVFVEHLDSRTLRIATNYPF